MQKKYCISYFPMHKVSVIVPNYNYENFIEERLDSIVNQTFKDFEIIFLDDSSSDESVNKAKMFMKAYPDVPFSIHLNEVNSGSPFKQWNKGVQLARSPYIWIAEADDFCERNFLERTVQVLDSNENVGVVYSQSAHVDSNGKNLGSIIWSVEWLGKEHWEKDFINDGREEIKKYLIYQNTIPNASGVLFRKSVYDKIGGASTKYRLMGDWATWIKMLSVSDLAFISDVLNYFRVHDRSVRNEFDTKKEINFIRELYALGREISTVVDLSDEDKKLMLKHFLRICLFKLKENKSLTFKIKIFMEIIKQDPFFFSRLKS